MKVLFELGTNGAVSGDSFIKVAYEEPYTDSIGRLHPGRVRILPLNAAYCYPEYHPHDRTRLIRVKIKYRFYGCVDEQTEALTREGWKSYTELSTDDEILTLDPDTDQIRWQPVQEVLVFEHQGYLTQWSGKVDALTTDNHRWLAQTREGQRFIARSSRREGQDPALSDLESTDSIVIGGGIITPETECVQDLIPQERLVLSGDVVSDELVPYDGDVWCPRVESGIWFARRNGNTYWTGNTSPQGTRSVYTYVEILTEDVIEEYVNDELIDSRPNPLGQIPVVHIPNIPVPSSPWGLSDCQDIIGLNLHYNEVSTDVADIVNYYSAPVTVITGAKTNQLEKGAKKVWGGLPKDASVFNLEGGGQGLQGALSYLEMLKRAMHEMVGIPENALGQTQPISNTSGVALSILYQPLINRWNQKVAQYSEGLQRINELILLNLAVKEPAALRWDPSNDVALEPEQVEVLDPADPITYITTVHFPPPLPLDKLVLLNEIQMLSQMGLESREGALRMLGEEFPEEKLEEIRNELRDDALSDGALTMIKTQIQKEIMDLTGMMPGVDGGPATPVMDEMTPDGDVIGDGVQGPAGTPPDQTTMDVMGSESELRNQLVTKAFGTKLPQRRKPDSERNDH